MDNKTLTFRIDVVPGASAAAVFITRGDVGVGTIVGSAVFNILVIIGLCGIFAGQVVWRTHLYTPEHTLEGHRQFIH